MGQVPGGRHASDPLPHRLHLQHRKAGRAAQAVQEGIISEDVINHAVFRILAWKYQMNLMPLDK